MKRVVVIGGLGSFGSRVVSELRALGVEALSASRRPARGPLGGDGGDISLDAEEPASIRRALRPGDVVVDAAGPFQTRTTVLLEVAMETGFDVVDLNDSLDHAERILALEESIAASGARVLTSASSVSAISAAVVSVSGLRAPARVDVFLAPASMHTANRASALSLLRSIGAPVRVFRDGKLVTKRGWSEPRRLPMPEPFRGALDGRLFESADSVHLPRAWPSLRDVAMYVDTNTRGLNALFSLAARVRPLRRVLERSVEFGTRLARALGSEVGGLGYDIADASGECRRLAIVSERGRPEAGFIIAVAPAVMAAAAIVAGRFDGRGLIPPERQIEPHDLIEFIKRRAEARVEPIE